LTPTPAPTATPPPPAEGTSYILWARTAGNSSLGVDSITNNGNGTIAIQSGNNVTPANIIFANFMHRRVTNSSRISGFSWNPCSDNSYIYNVRHSQTGVGETSAGVSGLSRAYLAMPSGSFYVDKFTNHTKVLGGSNPDDVTTSWVSNAIITGTTNSTNKSLSYNGTNYILIPLDTLAYSGSVNPVMQYKVSGCAAR
jgi:hypothetical protein